MCYRRSQSAISADVEHDGVVRADDLWHVLLHPPPELGMVREEALSVLDVLVGYMNYVIEQLGHRPAVDADTTRKILAEVLRSRQHLGKFAWKGDLEDVVAWSGS